MKPGDLRRWKYPDQMPSTFLGAEIIMIISVSGPGVSPPSVDLITHGKIHKSWNLDWVHKHSEALNEAR